MAKIFETEQDRETEEKMLRRFESLCGGDKVLYRTVTEAATDGVQFENGLPIRVVETRRRNNPVGQYPDLAISATKIWKNQVLAELLKVEFMLVIQWDDALGVASIGSDERFMTEAGGRAVKREGAANDWEVMAHIPMTKFKLFDIKADQ